MQLTRERRASEERAQEEKAAADLSSKLQTADEKRQVQISCIQDKARSYNERVSKRVEETSAKLQEESTSKKEALDEKMKKAGERYEAQLESVKQTAKESQVMKQASPSKETSQKVAA